MLYRKSKFKESDAFVGFKKDTPGSVVFQATNLLNSACAAVKERVGVQKRGKWADILRWSKLMPEDCYNIDSGNQWEHAVRKIFIMVNNITCFLPGSHLE